MSFIGKLLGTEKAVDSLLDKDKGLLVRAGGWVNDLSYTEAEKAENTLLVKEWGLKQLSALEPFKVVQRIMSFAACFMWLLVGLNVVAAMWVEALHPEIKISESMFNFASSDYVFWPVLCVFGLYMSGGVIPSRLR